jgi:hypothetical protein
MGLYKTGVSIPITKFQTYGEEAGILDVAWAPGNSTVSHLAT